LIALAALQLRDEFTIFDSTSTLPSGPIP